MAVVSTRGAGTGLFVGAATGFVVGGGAGAVSGFASSTAIIGGPLGF
tara:strand:+ start:222 stop:362 length:141 start_codon:yes stop_codon:yes gene_type:complete